MDTFNGLPTHPLLVHIPVALLPLAALGVLVLIVRRSWYDRYRWAVLVIGGIGTLGAVLAAASGEGLESQLRAKEGAAAARQVHDHAESGDISRVLAIVFFIALAAYVVVPWYLDRRRAAAAADARPEPAVPTWTRPVLTAAVAITALASMVSIIDAGHSGASRVWADYDTSSVSGG